MSKMYICLRSAYDKLRWQSAKESTLTAPLITYKGLSVQIVEDSQWETLFGPYCEDIIEINSDFFDWKPEFTPVKSTDSLKDCAMPMTYAMSSMSLFRNPSKLKKKTKLFMWPFVSINTIRKEEMRKRMENYDMSLCYSVLT